MSSFDLIHPCCCGIYLDRWFKLEGNSDLHNPSFLRRISFVSLWTMVHFPRLETDASWENVRFKRSSRSPGSVKALSIVFDAEVDHPAFIPPASWDQTPTSLRSHPSDQLRLPWTTPWADSVVTVWTCEPCLCWMKTGKKLFHYLRLPICLPECHQRWYHGSLYTLIINLPLDQRLLRVLMNFFTWYTPTVISGTHTHNTVERLLLTRCLIFSVASPFCFILVRPHQQ